MKWTPLDDKPEAFSDITWDIIKMDVPAERVNQKYREYYFFSSCLFILRKRHVTTKSLPLSIS